MKILHIEMGRQLDGPARQVAYLLNSLGDSADDHVLVCVAGAEIIGAITNRSVKISRIKAKEARGLKLISNLRKTIRQERADLLHIHSRPGDGTAVWAGWRERKTMVYSIREDRKPNMFDVHIKYPRFTRIIALSQGIHRTLREANVPDERLLCIPGAVDAQRFKPGREAHDAFLAQFSLRGDGPVLAMFAQLTSNKGHSVFFGALPAVLARYPTARVLVFGKGPAKDDLSRELKRRNLEKFVSFVGYYAELETIIPHVDMVIHPSFSEGIGGVLMEAAACGVPIIASRVGGIPDVVSDRFNGYLVKPGDSQNLARHILALLDEHDSLVQFGKTGRELMLEKFSIERMVAQHRALYREV